MERGNLLLLLGFLAAAATVGAQPGDTEASSCDPESLAAQVALYCTPDVATARCCEPVVASVDLRGCLCRVAAELPLIVAGFNATKLVAFYTACGGRGRMRAAHLAATCEGVGAPTVGAQPGDTASLSCNPRVLARQVENYCAPDSLTTPCCEAVVPAVDIRGCLCRVAETEQILSSGIDIYGILDLYTACGGLRPGGRHLASICQGKALPPLPPIE